MAAANLVRSTPLGLFVKTGKVFVKLPYSSLFFTLHVGGILDAGRGRAPLRNIWFRCESRPHEAHEKDERLSPFVTANLFQMLLQRQFMLTTNFGSEL